MMTINIGIKIIPINLRRNISAWTWFDVKVVVVVGLVFVHNYLIGAPKAKSSNRLFRISISNLPRLFSPVFLLISQPQKVSFHVLNSTISSSPVVNSLSAQVVPYVNLTHKIYLITFNDNSLSQSERQRYLLLSLFDFCAP